MSERKENRDLKESISQFSTKELEDELERRKDGELSEEVCLNEEM